MDMASLSIGMNQASVQNSVQISVMKRTMDDSQVINDQMTKMLDNMAVDENRGRNLDARV